MSPAMGWMLWTFCIIGFALTTLVILAVVGYRIQTKHIRELHQTAAYYDDQVAKYYAFATWARSSGDKDLEASYRELIQQYATLRDNAKRDMIAAKIAQRGTQPPCSCKYGVLCEQHTKDARDKGAF